MHRLTRRQTTAMLIAAGAVPALAAVQNRAKNKVDEARGSQPAPAVHQKSAELLAALLNDRLQPGFAGKFTVPAFDIEEVSDGLEMRAVVRLDWPPGWRQRPLVGAGGSDEAALRSLFDACIRTFDKAWPGSLT